jgi:phosphatidate cytidylyltransferase
LHLFYIQLKFFCAFGIFLIIAVYEFCNLIQINNVFPIVFGIILYTVTLISHYSTLTITINQTFNTDVEIAINIQQLNVVFFGYCLGCIHKMHSFYVSIQNKPSSKYLYLWFISLLPFVFITKSHLE